MNIDNDGQVTDGERTLGWVEKVEWPHSRNGQITVETRWEAQRAGQMETDSPVGDKPTFQTRQEAANFLAGLPSREDELLDKAWGLQQDMAHATGQRRNVLEGRRDTTIKELIRRGVDYGPIQQKTGLTHGQIHHIDMGF